MTNSTSPLLPFARLAGLLVLALFPLACGDDGHDGAPGPPGAPADPPPTDSELGKFEDPPGVNAAITGVSGQTGPTGNFQPGDLLTVEFTVTKGDGQPWDLDELGSANIMVSGPSVNYQYVLERQSDLGSAAVHLGNGAYRYTFAEPIPAAYLPYENNPGPYDVDAGELAGQPLQAGTYTVGMYMRFNYTVDGESHSDVGNAVFDFLLGNTGTIQPHEVVTLENCNSCHQDLRAHGVNRKDPKLCVLCHVAGETDGSTSVDFKVMIHKLHNAAHLPSVLGVATHPDGSRNYAATPTPYEVGGTDFSEVAFPVWPNLSFGMPRDLGYTALGATEKSLEDAILGGVTACDKCHGDPDGDGELQAPGNGDLAYLDPSRAACGSCHDDIDWELDYTANGQTMTAGAVASTACNACHAASSDPLFDPRDPLAVRDAHLHPLLDTEENVPASVTPFNPGLNFVVSEVTPVSTDDGGAAFQVGDKVAVTFALETDDGTPVAPAELDTTISIVMVGPNTNSTLLMYTNFNKAAITGPGPDYTVNLPELLWLENVGEGDGTPDQAFGTLFTPHWHDVASATSVRVVTGPVGGTTTLDAAAPARQNFLDVASVLAIAAGDHIVIDEGLPEEEYMQVQRVTGTRLWFASLYQNNFPPSLRQDHDDGAIVQEVSTTALTTPAQFTVNAADGEVTEVGDAFGTGQPILVTYTTDFRMPAVYAGAFNDSPDRDETWADWSGKPLADGTYRVALWCRTDMNWVVDGTPYGLADETTAYRALSPGVAQDVLVGTATEVEPYDLISSQENCYACHNDMYFHGNGRRGVETCLICHSVAGAEDHPQYRTPAAPATTGVLVNFREMIHKIHMGAELTNASSYTVAGNAGSSHTYEHVEFPALPDGVKNCAVCHGEDNEAWFSVANRDHPTDQTLPAREWRAVCTTCHDSDAVAAHVESQTVGGVESCTICHGEGAEFGVEVMHRAR